MITTETYHPLTPLQHGQLLPFHDPHSQYTGCMEGEELYMLQWGVGVTSCILQYKRGCITPLAFSKLFLLSEVHSAQKTRPRPPWKD